MVLLLFPGIYRVFEGPATVPLIINITVGLISCICSFYAFNIHLILCNGTVLPFMLWLTRWHCSQTDDLTVFILKVSESFPTSKRGHDRHVDCLQNINNF